MMQDDCNCLLFSLSFYLHPCKTSFSRIALLNAVVVYVLIYNNMFTGFGCW